MMHKRKSEDNLETVMLHVSIDDLSCGTCVEELALRVVQCTNGHCFYLQCIEKGAAINPSARSSHCSAWSQKSSYRCAVRTFLRTQSRNGNL